MANSSSEITAATLSTSKAQIGNEIVTQTLDKLNNGSMGGGKKCGNQSGMSDTYNFSKQVLSSVYEGKGAIADMDS